MRPRVHTAALGRWVDPVDAWMALCGGAESSFWLDSGPSALTGMSYLGVAESLTCEFPDGVMPWLRAREAGADTTEVPVGFALGWVGWLGYELRGETMGVAVSRASRYPDAAWMFVSRCLAFNHETGAVTLLALDEVEAFRAEVEAALAVVERSRDRGATEQPVVERTRDLPAKPPAVSWAYSDDEYLAMIEACQDAIREGEAYQLCLTTEARVDARPDPFTIYQHLRASSPTHHGALLVAAGVSLLSASPEQFLSVSADGAIESKPIKGTRPRGLTGLADEELRFELESNEKERAENLMIVDLMRNDIGRVSAVGSVAVTSLLAVESYAHVHQLVSTVRGQLAAGLTSIDAIEACFPAGSMTGAPKRSATTILDSLERRPRGIYSGAFGYLGLDGAVDLAMVIRSIILDSEGATIGTGGGITAMSVPEDELAEAYLKAEALLRVLGAGG